jgi:hypothetical protein
MYLSSKMSRNTACKLKQGMADPILYRSLETSEQAECPLTWIKSFSGLVEKNKCRVLSSGCAGETHASSAQRRGDKT